ncbi:AraC family transcriptional regulator [Cohnella sp. 56]|uniref:AraC family transcriptional regulator n=1 Tax=Cohnella sp. 56 TaxID=3113722 RepID=UPI0030E790AF
MPKAPKAPVHRSELSEHFQGTFPLFINRWEEGFALREHTHAYLEVVYVMSGDGYHYIGDCIERVAKGSLYVLPVGTSHMLRPSDAASGRKLIVYNLCVRPEFVNTIRDWLDAYGRGGAAFSIFDGAPGTYVSLTDRDMRLGRRFDRLHREYIEQRSGYEASMLAGLMQIAVHLTRLAEDRADNDEAARHDDTERTGMSAILSYIDHHVGEPLAVEGLAAQAGMSPRHFIRLFRKHAGLRFTDYVQLRRIEYACRLLLETDDKISAIAGMAGYRDQAYFRKVFHDLMGMRPSEYRRRR